jgi:hypothetical protein
MCCLMMNRIKTLNWVVLILFITTLSRAQMPAYQYKRSIQNISQKGWYIIPLPSAVMAKLSINFNDLRIFDITGVDTTEIPYLSEILQPKTEKKEVPFIILNQSHKQTDTYVTLKQSSKSMVNMIHLELSDRNFDGLVTVEGSTDQKEWFMIRDNHRMVRINNDYVNYDYTDLYFNQSNYEYFRLTIKPVYYSRKIKVRGASMYMLEDDKGSYDELMIQKKDIQQKKAEKFTEITVQLSNRYMISKLSLVITSDKDYYRRFDGHYLTEIVKTPKGDVEQWASFYSGIVSSIEDNTFHFPRIQSNKIKITIHNRDDQPLSISEIKLWEEQVRLKAELLPDRDYYMVYGKTEAPAPQYDIVYFKDKIPDIMLTALIGPEMICSQPSDNTITPWFVSKWWLWSVMLLVIVILGYFSYQLIKGAKKM